MEPLDRDPILEALGAAVLLCEESGRVVYASHAIEDQIGWSVDQIAGRSLDDLLAPDATGLNTPPLEPAGSLGPATYSTFVRPDGTPVSIECRRFRVGDSRALWTLTPRFGGDRPDGNRQRLVRLAGELTRRLGPRPELDSVLREATTVWLDGLGAARARIWLIEPASGRLSLRALGDRSGIQVRAWGMVQPADSAWPPAEALEEGRSGRAVWAEDHATDPFVLHPLRAGGKTLGVAALAIDRPTTPLWHSALGSTLDVVAIALEGVESRRREDAVRREEDAEQRRVRALLDLTPMAILLAEGPAAQLTLVNPTARALCGRPNPPRTLEEFHDLWPTRSPDGRPHELPQQPLWRALHWGESVSETLHLRSPDGRQRVIEVRAQPFPGPRGGAIATYNDITHRADVQAELTERAAQVRALLEHLPVGVAYFDAESVCRACNGFSWRTLGRTRSQMIGAASDEIFVDAPVLRDALRRCVVDRLPHTQGSTPWPAPSTDATARHLEWRFEPLPPSSDGAAQGALALIVDVTARKQADDALRAAKEAAEDSAHSKARFLSAISHDLRTPVNALNLQANIVSQFFDRLDRESAVELGNPRGLVRGLRQAASNLVELVNDLLDLTRFDSGEASQHLVDFDLREWLDATLSPLALEATSKGLHFAWSIDATPRCVRADRVKLGRVLTNLVGNALKFTEEGSVEVSVEAPDGDCLRFGVRDTGPGIPADQLGRIFDEFAQLRNPERDRDKGTGLGLAICRRLVEAVGGSVHVSSVAGRGSLFTVQYPVGAPAKPDAERRPADAFEAVADAATTIEAHVLLVEDDDATRDSMTILLESAGYRVTPAPNGGEALECLRLDHFDLVLLDLMMPGIDGTEVLRRIRSEHDRIALPVIILSGDVLDERADRLKAIGATATLSKPVDFDELLDTVGRYNAIPVALSELGS